MRKITKLSIFDFDQTLIAAPLPDDGKIIYQKKTGNIYPHVGWWGKADSLNMTIFDFNPIEDVFLAYEKERSNEETLMVMMTGRMIKLSSHVEAILHKNNMIHFDKHIYNMGGSTIDSKLKSLDKLLIEHQEVTEIELWDDRVAHIPVFQAWGDKQIESGRITSFKINLVPSDHHGE